MDTKHLLAAAAFLLSGAWCLAAADQIAADPDASAKTKATLNWLSNLHDRPDNKVVIGQYPGNACVDIISPDKYDNVETTLYNEFTGDRYQKVFAWGEIGQNEGSIDNRTFIHQIRTTFPKTTFYLQWADNRTTRSIRSNTFYDEVMDDDWIITLDELKSGKK